MYSYQLGRSVSLGLTALTLVALAIRFTGLSVVCTPFLFSQLPNDIG